ncbi:MAG: isocitrate lyase/phosphoenolpyruvate mutase family protein [Actinobacteria bacterium]|nr:isocitrate lyase/phosphoenolpyruvate mutase family protein [Actinomycetota bacterium]
MTTALRAALRDAAASGPVRTLGAVNAIAACVAADAGFDALWVSGLEVSAAGGLPDTNVLGVRDLADVVTAIGRRCALPVVVDVDNAGGSVATAHRYAHDLIRAGAAALCLEDSGYPKCNSFSLRRAQRLADPDLVCDQLREMRRAGDGLVLIARTEALIAEAGLPAALERARLYSLAGADAVLMHSRDPSGQEALNTARAWREAVPLVTLPTAFPQLSWRDLWREGFGMCIYPNQLTRAALVAMRATAGQFAGTGTFLPSAQMPLGRVGDLMAIGEPDARACV